MELYKNSNIYSSYALTDPLCHCGEPIGGAAISRDPVRHSTPHREIPTGLRPSE